MAFLLTIRLSSFRFSPRQTVQTWSALLITSTSNPGAHALQLFYLCSRRDNARSHPELIERPPVGLHLVCIPSGLLMLARLVLSSAQVSPHWYEPCLSAASLRKVCPGFAAIRTAINRTGTIALTRLDMFDSLMSSETQA